MAMGQNPNRPSENRQPEMGGEFTYQPKWYPIGFDNHSHMVSEHLPLISHVCALYGDDISSGLHVHHGFQKFKGSRTGARTCGNWAWETMSLSKENSLPLPKH